MEKEIVYFAAVLSLIISYKLFMVIAISLGNFIFGRRLKQKFKFFLLKAAEYNKI